MGKESFVFLSDENKYGSLYDVLLADILNENNVFYLPKTFKIDSYLFNKVKKILFSTILNIKFNEKPCKIGYKLLKKQYALKDIVIKQSKEYDVVNVIFFNASIKRFYSNDILKDIKKINNNIRFTMFFMDPTTIFASNSAVKLIEEDSSLFDYIFTVDKSDADKYGWKYWPTPYSKIMEPKHSKYDMYFCGATKNRHNLLIELINYFRRSRLKAKMDVFYIKKNETNLDKLLEVIDIKSIDYMKEYRETIEEMVGASCILEIITEGQSATFTLRAYEAIVYNKKLLTNNKMIFEFPYYNDKYMKYFDTTSDIDIEWIKSNDIVDYKYNGEYSPKKLLKEIEINNELHSK